MVKSEDITSPRIVSRRLGKLTAVLHALGSNDMHHENVAFVDDRPCLLDMETLFHPSRQSEPRPTPQGDVGLEMFENSVLNIGILPSPSVYSDNGKMRKLDISVMGVTDNQQGGVRAPQIIESNQGLEVKYEWGKFNFDDDVPARSELKNYAIDFLEGFEETYRVILAHYQ